MTLKEAAQIYVDLIHLEESLAPDQHQAKQEVSALRSKYHDLFTQVLREAGISCADRFEATQQACELIASSEMITRDDFDYTTVDGRCYQIVKTGGWQEEQAVPRGAPHLYCEWWATSRNDPQVAIRFCIGFDTFFKCLYKPGEIPQELAALTILWLLEEDAPTASSSYLGVFEQRGLQHKTLGPIDEQFGRAKCRTLPDLVEEVRLKWMQARNRDQERQIGFRSSQNEFWTLAPEIVKQI